LSTPPARAGLAATPRSTPPSSRKNKKALVVNPRLVVGAQVHIKAINVTSFMEVSRFRGALAKEVFMTGKVLKVVAGRDRGGRNKTDLLVEWSWLSSTKVKQLAKANVRPGPAPTPEPLGLPEGSPFTQASHAGSASPAPPPPATSTPPRPGTTACVVHSAAQGGQPARLSLATASTVRVVATAHGLTWTKGAVTEPVGGPVPRQTWSVRTLSGEVIHEDGDVIGAGQSRKPYDFFMAMFPMRQLALMVSMTSARLMRLQCALVWAST